MKTYNTALFSKSDFEFKIIFFQYDLIFVTSWKEDFFLKSSRPDGLSPAVVMQERNRPASLRTLLVL